LRIFLLDAPTPALAQLCEGASGRCQHSAGLEVPLGDLGPEEVLAVCLRFEITARATRIVEGARSG
jgi:hypothetical protein